MRAIRAIHSSPKISPDGQLVVVSAMGSITRALRSVSTALVVQDDFKPERPSGVRLKEVVEAVEDDDSYNIQPRDPALIEQEIRGCKTLLLEVVRRAAYDWVLYRMSQRLLHKKLAEDAYTWLFEEAPGHPNWDERVRQGKHITGFLSICSELDLDAPTVRRYVRRLTIKNVMSVGRPAEYRRRDTSSLRDRPALTRGGSSDDF